MNGLHFTADLYQCRCDAASLRDAQRLHEWCAQALEAAGLHATSQAFHASAAVEPAQPGGVALALLMPGGHLCVHTWPAVRGVALDVYLGSGEGSASAQVRLVVDHLVALFQPEWTEQRSMDRGDSAA